MLESFKEDIFDDVLGERYLAYALSTIMSRSLPDVRDGLKPVHRRILYDMMLLRLLPTTAPKKCARVVGDVIGKFHPHGDQAVYDALVRLAQDFSVRYPLIDGQGNFGSIDGDNAAAMRYTEARLTEIALTLLKDIELDTVDFQPNYDNHEQEPTILPARFPNLLANGSEGIAVGMATSIPPHNLDELCEATLVLLKNPDTSIEKLIEIIPGPDFPTGATIVENKENIINAYKTGKGGFRVRAKWHKEELSHGLYQIIVTEIPYQVQKSKLIEKIADLYRDKKLPLLSNIRDESAENLRIIFEPKSRSTNAEMLMESLFRLTELETRITLNLNVINSKSVPQLLNIREVLLEFIDHREKIIIKRSKFKLDKINNRLEILQGFITAFLNLDEVIRIIRFEDYPKESLMQKFSLSDLQAEAILNMKLRSLRKLEEEEIKKEIEILSAEKSELQILLHDENKRKELIAQETKEIKQKFGKKTKIGARRTDFASVEIIHHDNLTEALVEKEPITVICSKLGWLRTIKSHNVKENEIKYKEGDSKGFIIHACSTDKLLLFTNKGKFYTIFCKDIAGGKSYGDSIRVMIDIEDDDNICDLIKYETDKKLLIATKNGKGFIVNQKDVVAQTKSGKNIMNVATNDQAEFLRVIDGDHVAIIGTNRKMVIFPIEEIAELKKGAGVILQKYKDGFISDIKIFDLSEGLSWSLGERTRTENQLDKWLAKRGSVGKLPPVGFPRNNKFS